MGLLLHGGDFTLRDSSFSPDPKTFWKPRHWRLLITVGLWWSLCTGSGAATATFSNNDDIALPELTAGAAIPYPSSIVVSGLTAAVENVTVTLTGIYHVYPDDLDILLVGPGGGKIYLMSDAGLDNSMTNVTLTFDDSASRHVPAIDPIVSGSYRPTNYGTTADRFNAPAPAGPYATNLAIFRNTNPNGEWSLFVMDDLPEDSGFLSGWQLLVTTSNPIADLDVAVTAGPGPFFVGQPLQFEVTVTNRGPAHAGQVMITNQIPSAFYVTSIQPNQGSCLQDGDRIICAMGTVPAQQTANVRILGQVFDAGSKTNRATAGSVYLDLIPANNLAISTFPVQPPPAFTTVWTQPETIVSSGQGFAVPYPSTLLVSGHTSGVAKVTVTVRNLAHEFPDKLYLLLAGPAGQHVVLMGQVGGSQSATNITLVFDDDASAVLPGAEALAGGIYRPSPPVAQDFAFPAPAPSAPHDAVLAAFHGTNPNGAWSLYLADAPPASAGLLKDGWSLTLRVLEESLDPYSRFTGLERGEDGAARLVFEGQAGLRYVVQISENLRTWHDLGPAVEVGPGLFERIDHELAPTRFYQVRSD